MVHGLFLTRSDPELTGLVRNMSPEASALMRRTRFRLCQDSVQEEIRSELQTRRERYEALSRNLKTLKPQSDFAKKLRTLNKAIVLHDHHLRDLHAQRAQAREE